MTTRLAKSAKSLLDHIDLSRASPRRVGTLVAHEGLMLEVEGFPAIVINDCRGGDLYQDGMKQYSREQS